MIEKSRRELKDYTVIEYERPTTYTIKIKNVYKEELKISKELYNFYVEEHKKEQRQDRQARRYNEKSEIYEFNLYNRIFEKPKPLDEEFEEKVDNEKIHKAINMLSPKEKRRIVYRYYNKLKLSEIGKLENCSRQAIQYSIYRAEKKILKNLKKLKF